MSERRKPEELLPKFMWDILPAYPPYPPLPRGLLRGVFGREFEKKLTLGGTLTLRYDESKRIFTWIYRNTGRFDVYLSRVDILKEETPGTYKGIKTWGTGSPTWKRVRGGESVNASYEVPTADIGKKFYARAELYSYSSEKSSTLVATYRK